MATPNSLFSSTGTQAINIVIVGGGVAGLATAISLHRIGLKSQVLELADSLRTTGAALTVWANGWRALDALGVADTLRANYSQHERRSSKEFRCIERQVLLETLDKALPQGSIRFNSKLVSIHKKAGSPFTTLELADRKSITAKDPIVIGCDGVNSVVAQWIGLEAAKNTGRIAFRGMGECPQGYHPMEKMMLQVMGAGVRAGMIPCAGKRVFWFITRKSQPQDAQLSHDLECLRRSALETVRGFPEPIEELVQSSSADTLTITDLRFRWEWPWKWSSKGKGKGSVTVVGDAFHPMTPDLGQGACSALEDVVILARCFSLPNVKFEDINLNWGEEEERKVEKCFQQYLAARKWRVLSVVGSAFVSGNVLDGYSSFLRFLRDWIWFPFFSMSHLPYFASISDCGTLPTDKLPFSSSPSAHAHEL
eukprot:PITA_34961